mgnify:CR=1 FL=1
MERRQYRVARRPLLATPRFYIALLATVGALTVALLGVLRVDSVQASVDATVDGLTFDIPEGPDTLSVLPEGARLERLVIARASVLVHPREGGNVRLRRSEAAPLRNVVLRAGEGGLRKDISNS